MSGGVDSSVAAALLLEQGHDVTGVTMRLWPSDEDEDGCCAVNATHDAKRVCDLLGIAHYTVDYRSAFEREIVDAFADEYARGRTPNPCVECNVRLKFTELLAEVWSRGADYLATGHYARIVRDASGEAWLARGLDSDKDQSYFLYRLTAEQARRVLFPVGELRKSDVRSFARRLILPVAEKAESQEACFAADGDYLPAVRSRRPEAFATGEIVDESGTVLGMHAGIPAYTVGQRKGLGIGGAGDPLYVLALDAEANRIIVGPASRLGTDSVRAERVVWRGGPTESVMACVRYRMNAVPAVARFDGKTLDVAFESRLPGISPGQSVVCYRGDIVIGGGVISCAT
jgi:tRNA-specific 2-thiouridylase